MGRAAQIINTSIRSDGPGHFATDGQTAFEFALIDLYPRSSTRPRAPSPQADSVIESVFRTSYGGAARLSDVTGVGEIMASRRASAKRRATIAALGASLWIYGVSPNSVAADHHFSRHPAIEPGAFELVGGAPQNDLRSTLTLLGLSEPDRADKTTLATEIGRDLPIPLIGKRALAGYQSLFRSLYELDHEEDVSNQVPSGTLVTARTFLQKALAANWSSPKMDYTEGEAIVFVWSEGMHYRFVTVTDGMLALLSEDDGIFSFRRSSIPFDGETDLGTISSMV